MIYNIYYMYYIIYIIFFSPIRSGERRGEAFVLMEGGRWCACGWDGSEGVLVGRANPPPNQRPSVWREKMGSSSPKERIFIRLLLHFLTVFKGDTLFGRQNRAPFRVSYLGVTCEEYFVGGYFIWGWGGPFFWGGTLLRRVLYLWRGVRRWG